MGEVGCSSLNLKLSYFLGGLEKAWVVITKSLFAVVTKLCAATLPGRHINVPSTFQTSIYSQIYWLWSMVFNSPVKAYIQHVWAIWGPSCSAFLQKQSSLIIARAQTIGNKWTWSLKHLHAWEHPCTVGRAGDFLLFLLRCCGFAFKILLGCSPIQATRWEVKLNRDAENSKCDNPIVTVTGWESIPSDSYCW